MHEEYQAELRGLDPYVDILETAIYVAEAVDCLGRLCNALGIRDEDITLRLRLLGVQGRALTMMRGLLNARYQTALPEIHYEATRPVEDWTAGRVDLATEVTRELLLRFNWITLRWRHFVATFRLYSTASCLDGIPFKYVGYVGEDERIAPRYGFYI